MLGARLRSILDWLDSPAFVRLNFCVWNGKIFDARISKSPKRKVKLLCGGWYRSCRTWPNGCNHIGNAPANFLTAKPTNAREHSANGYWSLSAGRRTRFEIVSHRIVS